MTTREEIKSRARDYLRPDGSGKGYICPICGSGSGKKGTGLTTKDGEHFTCWAGCFQSADLIDIIGLEHGIATDDDRRYPEKLRIAAEELGIPLEEEPEPRQKRTTEDFAPDLMDYFKSAAQQINATDYWQKRGLSAATVKRFMLGYDPAWRHPKAPRAPATPRLIIPTSRESYLARDTRSEIPEEQKQYSKSKVGSVHIFNASAIEKATTPIFIVEGEIDAMSIIEVGGEAVALGSTSNDKKLLALLGSQTQPLILALDNDDAGRKCEERLSAALPSSYRLNVAGQYKDANERLIHDREGLAAVVASAQDLDGLRREEYRKQNSAAAHLQDFINGITASVNTPALSTGFAGLDSALDGGFYPGLYTIGAISSLGKTTLCLQIADNIARDGHDVLIISLEMARSELIAKSISRHTIERILETGGSTKDAKTTRGILDGKRWGKYSHAEKDLIQQSIKDYAAEAEHLYILEGIGNIGADQIREAVEEHRRNTGNTPFVLVDYMQIMAPADPRATDKQATDRSVLELKRISRDYNTPVLAVSSLNRENYNAKINMAAFKESGAIEYSADCLIGLQYAGAGSKSFDAEEAATKNPREIEAVILKHRNGRKGDVIPLCYYPMFNYFTEQGAKA